MGNFGLRPPARRGHRGLRPGGILDWEFKEIMQKFFFISIHNPPASIRHASIKHALAVTVEPFKFSPA